MKAHIIFIIGIVAIVAIVIYISGNSLNPNSYWCDYKIYKCSDGTFQVWSSCKESHLEETFTNYMDAKAFQIQKCNSLEEFLESRPDGQRVK